MNTFQSQFALTGNKPSATGRTGAYAQHLVRKLQAQHALLLKVSLTGILPNTKHPKAYRGVAKAMCMGRKTTNGFIYVQVI
jgi:hypothetical protein